MPNAAWQEIAIDFLGPIPSGNYLLVIIDYFSRYKEIEIMNRITTKETTDRLEKIFCRLGYPKTITLDNGPQLASNEFKEYCKTREIQLNFTPPYWPAANGLVERQNESILKRLQISNVEKSDWKADLLRYLLMYNTTPHSTTGKTPTELLFGRTIRDKIPSLQEAVTDDENGDARDMDKINKTKGKEREDRKRRAIESDIAVGDKVVAKNVFKKNKLQTEFNP
jgi:hypothetical protein